MKIDNHNYVMTANWPNEGNYKGPLIVTHVSIPEILKYEENLHLLRVTFPFFWVYFGFKGLR